MDNKTFPNVNYLHPVDNTWRPYPPQPTAQPQPPAYTIGWDWAASPSLGVQLQQKWSAMPDDPFIDVDLDSTSDEEVLELARIALAIAQREVGVLSRFLEEHDK